MRKVLTLIAGPFLAAGVLAVALAFPTPADLVAAVSPPDRDISIVNAGGLDAKALVTNIAVDLPTATAEQTVANNGECFQDLVRADKAKLDRCALVVYQALIEVERATNAGFVQDAIETPSRGRAVEQLRYAAVEVCRNQWANNQAGFALDGSPACEAAQISVATGLN